MLGRAQRFRPRPRRLARLRPCPGLLTEGLESRRLLAVSPINVAANLPVASGLPLPGLAYGLGLPTTSQTLPSSAVSVAPASPSVAPAPIVLPSFPAATGPATTLSPLMNDAETANATASESARPRPGLTDRISIILGPPEFLAPIVHLQSPNSRPVVPGPEIELFAPVPVPGPAAAPALPATVPIVPAPAAEAEPAPIVQASPVTELDPITLEAWDAALALIAADEAESTPVTLTEHTEAVMATGVLLAAWTGWKYGPRSQGRSRRQALAIPVLEAGPGGPGR